MAISPTLPVPEDRGLRALAARERTNVRTGVQGVASGSAFAPIGVPRLLRFWHLASLDAPTVAVVWCVAFGWVSEVPLSPVLTLVLGLCAWAFYIADRLLDARRSIDRRGASLVLRPRHYFHWQHRRVFVPLALAVTLLAIGLVLAGLPLPVLIRDTPVAAAALAYVASVHWPGWASEWPLNTTWFRRFCVPKELLVAILFTTACALPAWSRIVNHRGVVGLLWLCFVTVAWLNCYAIEIWESEPASGNAMLLRTASLRKSRFFWLAVLAVVCLLIAATVTAGMHQARASKILCAVSLSAALLGLLDRVRGRLIPTALRVAADLVLLTPLLILLLALDRAGLLGR